MTRISRIGLSAMMFLQFFVWGAWYVTAPNYLSSRGFKAGDFAWTYSVGPIAGMITPFFVGMIADRFFPAQRLLGILQILGGVLLLGAAHLMAQPGVTPARVNLALFAYMLSYFPTLALTNTIAMGQMTRPEKEFPGIRVFGTLGWIAAGLVLSYFDWDKTVQMFYLAGGAALALGLLSFRLPHTPPRATGAVSWRQILGLDALALLRHRPYLVALTAALLLCIPLAFYYQLTSRLVEMVGLPIGRTMAYGQMSEIFFMLVMPWFFLRLGVKWMLALGMLGWAVRYLLFSVGGAQQVPGLILVGIVLHGLCYDFFFVTCQIYTDQVAPPAIRGQAQGLLVLLTLGLGTFVGAQVAGRLEAQHTPPGSTDLHAIAWGPLWAEPAGLALVILVLFVVLFRPRRTEPPVA
jgi:nucleoside transporter